MSKKILCCVMAALLALTVVLAGCGAETPDSSSSVPAEDSAASGDASEPASEPAADAPSVLLVCGNANDKSFAESAANGLKELEAQYGCETKVVEIGSDTTKITPTLEDVSGGEWDLIVTVGFQYAEPLAEVAPQFPEQKYLICDTQMDYTDGANANVYSVDYKGNEGAFLSGALAAMVTTSDMENANPEKMVGFVGGMDMTLINDFVIGFIQGAHEIDPEVKVSTSYVGSFDDSAKGKEMANTLYNAGCDLVYNGAGNAGLGVLDAAKEQNKYAIGTDSDQSLMFADDEVKANLILTSQLKRIDATILTVVKGMMDGSLQFGSGATFGIKEGAIGLADNDYYKANVSQEMRDKVAELEGKVLSGEIVVDTAYGMETDAIKAAIDAARP